MSLFEVHETELRPDCRVIELEGELDLAVADQLKEALKRAEDFPVVLVDLQRCEFVDSTGIAALVHAHNERRSHGRVIAVIRPIAQVRRVLSVTGLTENGLVFDSAQEALEAIVPPGS